PESPPTPPVLAALAVRGRSLTPVLSAFAARDAACSGLLNSVAGAATGAAPLSMSNLTAVDPGAGAIEPVAVVFDVSSPRDVAAEAPTSRYFSRTLLMSRALSFESLIMSLTNLMLANTAIITAFA